MERLSARDWGPVSRPSLSATLIWHAGVRVKAQGREQGNLKECGSGAGVCGHQTATKCTALIHACQVMLSASSFVSILLPVVVFLVSHTLMARPGHPPTAVMQVCAIGCPCWTHH